MELFQEILARAFQQGKIRIEFPEIQYAETVEGECYRALKKIKQIIEDESLDDSECFRKIEAVICVLEDVGSDGGSRHDW